MKRATAMLKPFLGALHRQSGDILRAWADAPEVTELLARWGVDGGEFIGRYAVGIFDHLLSVMEGKRSGGDCPTLALLMERLASRKISVGDIFVLCIQLRHAIGNTLFKSAFEHESAGRYRQFLTALHSFFDMNLRGVLDRYYETLQQKEEELLRLALENKNQEQMLTLQTRQAMMGEMIGAIAHQWKQPLNTLSLAAQELQESFSLGALDKAGMEEGTDIILRQVAYMSRTVDDFRRFFKPSDKNERFFLQEAIDDAMALVGQQYRSRGIDVRFTADWNPAFEGRRNDFVQVLLILLSNARDAIVARNHPHGRIEVTLAGYDHGVRLCVRDNGGGIPEGMLTRLFTPYATTKPEGTGIGLYIARRIVEKMQGRLQASNEGEGALFCAELPAAPAKPGPG